MSAPGNLFEIDTATMSVRVLSPAGLVVAVIRPLDQLQLVHTICGLWLAKGTAQPVPQVVAMRYPGAPPPLEVVRPVANPVIDGDKT